ncbi:hypothetical protein [Nocardia macrotermitis]|uniref:GrpE protein n=1 Tax=Nocardia macrotermitis TaxID=2585198 RepID=A0A7K0DDL9_9NOCA|nr:hypothetical protein [Nocardia macrotermitis]MQY23900.1 hypothetical protein [Nocardia macrotermitis]
MASLAAVHRRIRQYRFPPEFRIPEPTRYLADPATAAPITDEPDPIVPADRELDDLDDAVVADVATGVWRVLRRFASEDGEAPRAQRLATRNLTAVRERLEQGRIRIQDHDGAVFDPGFSLDVMAYEPQPGFDREIVVETVLPSIYRSGRRIQIGQVIVGIPAQTDAAEPEYRDHPGHEIPVPATD